MYITSSQIKQIIKEELRLVLEGDTGQKCNVTSDCTKIRHDCYSCAQLACLEGECYDSSQAAAWEWELRNPGKDPYGPEETEPSCKSDKECPAGYRCAPIQWDENNKPEVFGCVETEKTRKALELAALMRKRLTASKRKGGYEADPEAWEYFAAEEAAECNPSDWADLGGCPDAKEFLKFAINHYNRNDKAIFMKTKGQNKKPRKHRPCTGPGCKPTRRNTKLNVGAGGLASLAIAMRGSKGTTSAKTKDKTKKKKKNFREELLRSETPVLAYFYADWCNACKETKPLVEKYIERKEGKIKVIKVNISKNTRIKERYDINSIPKIIMFKNGDETERYSDMESMLDILKK